MNYKLEEIKRNLSYDPDEPEFETLRRLGGKLKIPVTECFLSIEVLMGGVPIPIPDMNGKMVPVIHQRSRSWVRNAYNCLFMHMTGKGATSASYAGGALAIKNTAGTVTGVATYIYGHGPYSSAGTQVQDTSTSIGFLAAAGSTTRGIIVGGGTNAESFEDYALQTPIVEGTGAGQLSHVASEPHSLTYDSGTKTLTDALARYMNNNSGNSIGVNEVGLVNHVASGQDLLMSRDKLGATITVLNAGQLKVTYTLALVFPA